MEIGITGVVNGAILDHAGLLVGAMYNTGVPPPNGSYSVACAVDIDPSIPFSQVDYLRADNNLS